MTDRVFLCRFGFDFSYFTRFVETRRALLNDILEVITKIVRIENSVVNQSYS